MSLGEFELIARYFARQTPRSAVLLGIGDDAAVLDLPPDRRLVVAVDTIVEGVHFPVSTQPADIGYRALAVNLSDLAAMGAEPAWFTLSLSLPHSDEQWLDGFASGLFALANEFEMPLVGGDTVKGPLVLTVQIAGTVETDRWLTRSGARPGDALMISGIPGEAAGGLATVQEASAETDAVRHLRRRFFRPTPRVRVGRALREIASAAMDVSDGLLTDLDKLCAASGCGARVDVAAIPQSAALAATFDPDACVNFALAGGDDYELLFTIPPAYVARAEALGCTRIGDITADGSVVCLRDGREYRPQRRGYEHFDRGRSR
jgi:thiamine-monophosphate kinase